jgi:hypothetical protein
MMASSPHFADSEMVARNHAFDSFVAGVHEALNAAEDPRNAQKIAPMDPSARDMLPQLRAETDRLFLPDIQHGVAYLPLSERDGSGAALVPVGTRLIRDASMLMPTPERLALVMAKTGMSEAAVLEAYTQAITQRRNPSFLPHPRVGEADMYTTSRVRGRSDAVSGPIANLVSRSSLVIPQNDRTPGLVRAVRGVHELVHVVDSQGDWHPAVLAERAELQQEARREARGYHVQYYVGLVALPPFLSHHRFGAANVEKIRVQHTKPGDPFAIDKKGIKKMQAIGAVL